MKQYVIFKVQFVFALEVWFSICDKRFVYTTFMQLYDCFIVEKSKKCTDARFIEYV